MVSKRFLKDVEFPKVLLVRDHEGCHMTCMATEIHVRLSSPPYSVIFTFVRPIGTTPYQHLLEGGFSCITTL